MFSRTWKFWLFVIAIGFFCIWHGLPIVNRCGVSSYAQEKILSSLTADEQKTLKGMPTLSDPTTYCPLYFEYTKDGKHMAASAVDDFIHGTKIFYEDFDKYAREKHKPEASNSSLHTGAPRK